MTWLNSMMLKDSREYAGACLRGERANCKL